MKKVLVCDDDEGITEVIKIILTDNGYSVKMLSNGKGIQKRIKEYQPDILLLDIWMPGIDGTEITKILKREEATKHIPIIILSALNYTDSLAKESGADDFITKPFDMDELLVKIKKYTS